ncbi:MAG: stage II sporulation protein P, partial [Clostridia bacterium]|nr:stage II sporulation protein P [Clostridia bacterium]
MEQPIVQAQLELLCVRAKRTPSRSYRTHTAEITLKKRHTPHKYWTFLRRSTAICLSAVLLTATPEPNAILPDLIFQSEVDGFPAIYSAIDLPTVSLADTLAAQAESHTESAPPEVVQTPPPIRLDTGHDQPSNSRSEVGFLSRLSDQVEEEKIQTLTIAPTSDYGYDAHAGIRVLNGSGKTLNLPELLNESLTLAPVDNEPQVLIYHTHACEAYTPSELDSYTTDENDRCSDTAYNGAYARS